MRLYGFENGGADMLKWFLSVVGLSGLMLGILFWWLMLSGASAPKTAPDVFPVEQWRQAISATPLEARPTGVAMLEVMSAAFPSFVVQAGDFDGETAMGMTSFQIQTPQGAVIVGGAVDAETADQMAAQSGGVSNFDAAEYGKLTDAMLRARDVLITHEHLDHVMAIARHPNPAGIADQLRLNAEQKAALAGFTPDGQLPAEFEAVPPALSGQMQMIAPGILVAPASGHTAGAQVVFVSLQDGREYLLIGDIVWNMQNIVDLKTRPVLTQYAVFDPQEDRKAVKQQVRALHDLVEAEPALIIVPSHDREHLQGLVRDGALQDGFAD